MSQGQNSLQEEYIGIILYRFVVEELQGCRQGVLTMAHVFSANLTVGQQLSTGQSSRIPHTPRNICVNLFICLLFYIHILIHIYTHVIICNVCIYIYMCIYLYIYIYTWWPDLQRPEAPGLCLFKFPWSLPSGGRCSRGLIFPRYK